MKKGVYLLLSFLLAVSLKSQGQAYSYFVRVYFKDKGNTSYQAQHILSERAVARRTKSGIQFPVLSDFPVNSAYIDQIRSLGYTFHCSSKWMNTALFKTNNISGITSIQSLPFVAGVKIVKTPGPKSRFIDKLEVKTMEAGAFPYDRPITMLNGYTLHDNGFTGKNILIAVLDGGFTNADRIESLNALRTRNGIIFTWDFVKLDAGVYESSTHGTDVMSILAGQLPNHIAGTAPSADYILFKTEDVETEFPCEEDFWAAGAEFADSAGADIITSSLGYYEFDDPSMNYKQSDLDGNTAFVTRVADMAASKGIVVIVSAGNERDNPWRKIIFPSDGDSVIAAGAVDENMIIAPFSSAGPSADRRVKPDNVAMGVRVPIQMTTGSSTFGNGTSFSCPVLSGMTACLMQGVPQAINSQIIEALHRSGDRYNSPDSLYGFGVPDMAKAYSFLKDIYTVVPEEEMIITPNPATGLFQLIFKQAPGPISIEIYNEAGSMLYRKDLPLSGRSAIITDFQNAGRGIYFVKVKKSEGSVTAKLIKTR